VPTTDREAVKIMAQMDEFMDAIIPRGGHSLIENVVAHARMPVIKHYDGICHVHVDKDADCRMALDIAINAKCQRPGVCNAMETLLVHREIAQRFFALAAPEFQKFPVEMRADPAAFDILSDLGYAPLREADETSWRTEYWISSSLSVSWTAWRRRLSTSKNSAPTTAMPSSRKLPPRRKIF